MAHSSFRAFLVCSVVLTAITGCQPSVDLDTASDTPAASSDGNTAAGGQSRQPAGALVSTEDAEQFGKALAQAVYTNDETAFHRLIDWKAMANAATEGLGLSSRSQQQMANGLVKGITAPGRFVSDLRAGGEAKYEFLRARTVDGKKHVLFRLVSPEGMNFHDFTLDKVQGQVRAVELFVFLSGESMSETWKRLMLPVAKEQNKNWLQRLSSSESEFVKNLDQFQLMSQQVQQGDGAGALRTYESLPESLKKERVILLTRYQAASQVGEAELLAAADDFRAAHPDAKCIELLMVDAHLYRQEYDEAIACLDRIQNSVGPDAYLEFLAGSLLHEKGDKRQALERIRKATTIEPTVEDAFWALSTVSMEVGDYATTADALTRLEERFDVEWNNFEDVPEFAKFAESPEGKQWLQEHGQ